MHQSDNSSFPFTLNDITGWVIKRKDGVVIKYNLISASDLAKQSPVGGLYTRPGGWQNPLYAGGWKKPYSAWCNHEPRPVSKSDPPIFEAEGIGIWIGDNPGASKARDEFDVCIDGGNVLTIPGEYDLPTLYGDPALRRKLAAYLTTKPATAGEMKGPRILKVRWADRARPPVRPEFWPALLDELRGIRQELGLKKGDLLRVMTICQGGHGRSGSAAAALIMCLTDYTPLDALTHVRAIHCARAIESKEQHEYLNLLAEHLGRTPNALEAEGVPSFKARLLKMESKWALPYRERVEAGKGAAVEQREGAFI